MSDMTLRCSGTPSAAVGSSIMRICASQSTARPAATARVVVDASPYSQRLARDASYESRLEERRQLWRKFVSSYGLEAEIVDLAKTGDIHHFREDAK